MIINGKYGSIRVHAKTIEEQCIVQLEKISNSIISQDSQIEVMPDIHAGKGSVIGYTQTITDKINPEFVGVDVGCGMLCAKLKNPLDAKEFVDRCKKYIPVGFNTHRSVQQGFDYSKLHCELKNDQKRRIELSVGTLGSGNHFIELNENEQDEQYVVIHTGSRNLGNIVCNYHLRFCVEDGIKYLIGERKNDYLEDMQIAQLYAKENRETILRLLKLDTVEVFETIHNYISFEDLILRKGAISSHLGEKVLIPFNMRDGSIIAIGKGNKNWNLSAPHGAGRLMSRTEARKKISLEDFKNSMTNIYSETVNSSTIDESPFCYKDHNEIIEQIGETVDIIEKLKVIANFKGY